EFFSSDATGDTLAAQRIGPRMEDLEAGWREDVQAALDEATLVLPAAVQHVSTGKRGEHSEHMGYLLAEMQSVARQHPGATW
ncbi:MAG TPA: Phenylacetic acid catabolic protein, partial [Paraburkholderia sp.]|nr:Phenylacetic acid catabolic protein [Paraburkholderia sp.]